MAGKFLVGTDDLCTVAQLTLQRVQQRLGRGAVHQLVVTEILLLGLQNGQLLGLFTVVDDTLGDIITDEVILGIGENTPQTMHLTLKELDDIACFTKTNLLILTGKNFVENVNGIVSNSSIIGRIGNVDDVATR